MRVRTTWLGAGFAAAMTALLLTASGWTTDRPATERASVATGGVEANLASLSPHVSADGRYVAFASGASNLVAADANSQDIFVRDREASATEMVDVASDGTQADRPALWPGISGDGRYVVFHSDSDNLVPGDTNGASDVFVRDRVAGLTERVSVATGGAQGNGASETPSISADGRYVTFSSLADNLVASDTNGDRDVFLHDRQTGVTELISVSTAGVQGNFNSGGLGAGPARVSSDGRFVVFGSFASNLVPDDTNSADDIFLRDRELGMTERVSVGSGGTGGNAHSMYGDVSDDGARVVFYSAADNLVPGDTNMAVDVFYRDRAIGETFRLSEGPGGVQGDGPSRFPVISGDGGYVAFQSGATNLVAGDTNGVDDVFLFEMATRVLKRLSEDPAGGDADGSSASASISGDGSVVAYQSTAINLVQGDTNSVADVFVWGKPLAPESTSTPGATFTRTPAPPTATPTETPTAQLGDADCSESVNSIDAALVLQLVAELIRTLPCLEAGDVNASGAIDAIDAALILQFVAGFFDSLPP